MRRRHPPSLADAGFERESQVPAGAQLDRRVRQGRFDVDLDDGTVTCPAGHTVTDPLPHATVTGKASFKRHCTHCPLRDQCTTVSVGADRHHPPPRSAPPRPPGRPGRPRLAGRLHGPTRPKVERKIAHFVRRAWGGRKARVRGRARVATDLDTRAAAINWARLATLGLEHTHTGWTIA